MAENPDREAGELGKFAPTAGDLRFVLRAGDSAKYEEKGRTLRILQRFEWSFTDDVYAWYDIHLTEED